MVKVSIEVRNRTAHFEVAVRAESIQRALSLVEKRYPDSDDIGVRFPTDPEGFSVEGPPARRAGQTEPPERMAA